MAQEPIVVCETAAYGYRISGARVGSADTNLLPGCKVRWMTDFLASIVSPGDAEIALSGGADIIDLASVSGSIGLESIRATLAAIGGRRPLSVFVGDRPMPPDLITAAVRDVAAIGVDTIRLGIHPGGTPSAWFEELAAIAPQIKLVAVFFADASPELSLMSQLKSSGFTGAMLDVQDQEKGCLLDYCDVSRLFSFVGACRNAGLHAGLAGALETPDVPRLLVLAPDVLGFSGALRCDDGRTDGLDLGFVQAVRALIPPAGPKSNRRDVDYRLLEARPQILNTTGEDAPVDLVFVEDLVLPVYIGAYARERETPQSVRFAVTASVLRNTCAVDDMRAVFSYDLITDGIKMLIGLGHVAMVETLAERIAAVVLGHPRVTKVVVRVQKLTTGSGTVGVEIERSRIVARAADRPIAPLLAGLTSQSL